MAEDKNAPDPADTPAEPQPGTVISPGATVAPPAPSPAQPAEPAPTPAPDPPPQADNSGDSSSITWTASEFIAHHKSAGWYAALLVGTLLLAALIFLITTDIVSSGVAVVAGILLGIYGSHQPRQLEYRVDEQGVNIGQSHHTYDEFRSFSVVPEGAFSSIVFMPLRRFALPTTLYYAPADEDSIVGILTDQLPFENHKPDAIDRLMRRIRF